MWTLEPLTPGMSMEDNSRVTLSNRAKKEKRMRLIGLNYNEKISDICPNTTKEMYQKNVKWFHSEKYMDIRRSKGLYKLKSDLDGMSPEEITIYKTERAKLDAVLTTQQRNFVNGRRLDGLFTTLRDFNILIDENLEFNWSVFYELTDAEYSTLLDSLKEGKIGSTFPSFDTFLKAVENKQSHAQEASQTAANLLITLGAAQTGSSSKF